ncbi:MAG: hypothetical protein KIH63_001580 [Candidatus Saccharibacteria bacterium]|nr:hypothetical protein [Candidatus Saccharibacteria bacterium]
MNADLSAELIDPWVERWRFAEAVAKDPVAMAAMNLGPNISRFGETGKALYCMDQLAEWTDVGLVAASFLVEVPLEVPPTETENEEAQRPHIVGIATAEPDASISYLPKTRSRWRDVEAAQPITRVEACVVGDDKFNKMHELLSKVVARAAEVFVADPATPPVEFVAILPDQLSDKSYPDVRAGIGSVIPFQLAAGNYAWADRKKRFSGRTSVLGSSYKLLGSGLDQQR